MGEYSSKESINEEVSPMRSIKPFYQILILVIVFAAGLVLGFFGRPMVMPAEEVVVTVEVTSEAVVQATAMPQPTTAPAETGTETNEAGPTPTIMEFILSDTRHFLGDPNAPVTLIEFSDFRCGYCGLFAAEALPQLRQEYIDTGKVRFAYKHLAVLGADSVRAAEASECAAEQDKFWDYHDLVFTDQATNHTPLTEDNLVKLAGQAELDAAAFSDCLTSGRYNNQVMLESQAVQSLGVRGTPGFVVNGVYIPGAQPFEVFQQVIEEQLASAK
jgi:protein-disulfide isomerase